MSQITEADLRIEYARSQLDQIGIGFERACQSPVMLIALIAGINGRRRIEARRAKAADIQYQQIKEAA